MLSILNYYILPNLFYQIPIPLTIGNLPYGDFLNHLNEYEYLKVYKVPSLNMCLYWSKFHNNYILRRLDNNPEYIFPQLKAENILYSLNPFMNDLNGICSWINDEINTCSKIYYNTQTSKYEFGFGQDVPTNQGFLYNIISKDYNFTAYNDVEIQDYGEFYEQDFNDLAVWKPASSVKFQYSQNLFENISETKVFQIPNKDILTTQENWDTYIKTDKNITIQDNTYYFRIEDIPDLDGKGICGLYKNSKSDDYYAIGSWVCGVNGNQEFGKFIGVNARYSSQTYEKNYIGNSYEVVKQQQYTKWDFRKSRRDGKDEYVVLGKTYDLQTPKYLVHWNVKGFEQPYRCNRYFILEDEINPLKARKFWYCDLPNQSAEYYSPTRFFRRIN